MFGYKGLGHSLCQGMRGRRRQWDESRGKRSALVPRAAQGLHLGHLKCHQVAAAACREGRSHRKHAKQAEEQQRCWPLTMK